MKLPKIIGHRGAPAAMPANSLEGFQFAIETGADGLNLDVFLTRDGVPAVTSNPRLAADAAQDTRGWLRSDGPAIAAMSFAELQGFDIGTIRPGSGLAQKFPNQATLRNVRIPSLDQVLGLIKESGRDIEVMIELKHSPLSQAHPAPEVLATAAAAALRRHGLAELGVFHAFNWQLLATAASVAPEIRRSHLSIRRETHPDGTVYPGSPWLGGMAHEPAAMLRQMAQSGAAAWCPFYQDLDRGSLALAQQLGLEVITWTINGDENLQVELKTGVDGVITDDPARAVSLRAAAAPFLHQAGERKDRLA